MYNPYEVLGVKSTMSKAEIKQVYKKLCKIYHPDVGGSTEKFQEVLKAWRYIEQNHHDFSKKVVWRHTSLFSIHKEV